MTQNVHGHVVLEHIVDAGGTLPLAALRDFAQTTHGADATYYTCSASQMSFNQLLDFLLSRNKVSMLGDQVTVHVENMCNHGDGGEHASHA